MAKQKRKLRPRQPGLNPVVAGPDAGGGASAVGARLVATATTVVAAVVMAHLHFAGTPSVDPPTLGDASGRATSTSLDPVGDAEQALGHLSGWGHSPMPELNALSEKHEEALRGFLADGGGPEPARFRATVLIGRALRVHAEKGKQAGEFFQAELGRNGFRSITLPPPHEAARVLPFRLKYGSV